MIGLMSYFTKIRSIKTVLFMFLNGTMLSWRYFFQREPQQVFFMQIYEEPEKGSATYGLILASMQQNLSSVFELSDKARLKPVSSTTETSYKIENLRVASLDMILYN